MQYVRMSYGTPGHEYEYCVFLPATLESVRIPFHQNDLRYANLAELLKPYLHDYWISDRGTRIEIYGPRNDALMVRQFASLGFEINFAN